MKLNQIVLGLALAGVFAGASAAENLFATASNRLAFAEPGRQRLRHLHAALHGAGHAAGA